MNLLCVKRVRRSNLELNALEWEGNCYVKFRVRVSLTRQALVDKILLKSQLLQFLMHLLHNFLLKTYHLKCLKSILKILINISLNHTGCLQGIFLYRVLSI